MQPDDGNVELLSGRFAATGDLPLVSPQLAALPSGHHQQQARLQHTRDQREQRVVDEVLELQTEVAGVERRQHCFGDDGDKTQVRPAVRRDAVARLTRLPRPAGDPQQKEAAEEGGQVHGAVDGEKHVCRRLGRLRRTRAPEEGRGHQAHQRERREHCRQQQHQKAVLPAQSPLRHLDGRRRVARRRQQLQPTQADDAAGGGPQADAVQNHQTPGDADGLQPGGRQQPAQTAHQQVEGVGHRPADGAQQGAQQQQLVQGGAAALGDHLPHQLRLRHRGEHNQKQEEQVVEGAERDLLRDRRRARTGQVVRPGQSGRCGRTCGGRRHRWRATFGWWQPSDWRSKEDRRITEQELMATVECPTDAKPTITDQWRPATGDRRPTTDDRRPTTDDGQTLLNLI